MNDDPLLKPRGMPREAPADLRQRIVAIIGDDASRMHIEAVRLAVQARLEKEFGVRIVFQQEEPLVPIKNGPDYTKIELQVRGYEPQDATVRPKKPTIPIPNHRRKWWER